MKTKFIFFSLVISSLNAVAQDIENVNLNSDWVRMNPAYAGSNKGFRTQINNYTVANNNYLFQSAATNDFYSKTLKSGIAISANQMSVKWGVLKESSLALAYSKHLSLLSNKLELIPALQVAVLNKSLDVQALNFGDEIDPRWNMGWTSVLPQSKKTSVDLTAGALLDLKNGFVFGFTAKHINSPDIGLTGYYRLPQKYVVHVSYDKLINERNSFNVFAYLSSQAGTQEAKLQVAMVLQKHLYLGTGASVSNNYYSGSAVLGYKGNFWNASILLGTHYFAAYNFKSNLAQVSLAATIRDKEHRRSLTALHAW